MSRPGRNDPCPCGSGQKYKHCHLLREQENDADELTWRGVHQASTELSPRLLRYARTRYGPDLLHDTWTVFPAAGGGAFDPESAEIPLFISWLFFEWRPPSDERAAAPGHEQRPCIAEQYLAERGRYEGSLGARYLASCIESVFSYYDVIEVESGNGFHLRDALTGDEHQVIEKTASTMVQRGSILLARIATVDAISVLDCCAPIALPPVEKEQVIALRRRLRRAARSTITRETLRRHTDDLLRMYRATADRLMNPTMPVLSNTDGDLLMFSRVTYDVPSARAAFDALWRLSLEDDEASLLEDATFSVDGELQAVEFGWLRQDRDATLPRTSLGRIRIDGLRLVAELNSEERAGRFREIADRDLPPGSRHVSTVLEPVEAALSAYRDEHPEPERDPVNDLPELQALKDQYLRDHYRRWVDLPIPALGDKSPRQAMRSADGREMVEALLLELEQHAHYDAGVPADVLAELRQTLAEVPLLGRRRRMQLPVTDDA